MAEQIRGLFEDYLPQAKPVDKTYEGDNRPIYIKERTDITADQYNQFLAEFDDAVAQSNAMFAQAQIQQRAQQEATGTTYDRQERVLQNDALRSQLFNQAVSGIAEKYGVPMTFTTKGGETWNLNPNGKYTRVTSVGGFQDYIKPLIKAGITAAVGAGLTSFLTAPTGLGLSANTAKIIVAGLNAAATGGDPQDIVESMLLQGVTNEALDFIANNTDFKQALNDIGASVGIGDQVSVSGEWSTLPDGTEVLTETLETRGNLGDIIADVADTIANPSGFTPSSTESSNVILNLAGQAAENADTVGAAFPSLLDIYNSVIEQAGKDAEPSKPDAPDILIDTTQDEPIVVDEEENKVTVNVPEPITETTEDAGGGGGGGSTEGAITDASVTTTTGEPTTVPEDTISLEPWSPDTQYEIGDQILDAGGQVWTYIGKNMYSGVGQWSTDAPTDEVISEYESQTGDTYDPETTRIIVLGDPTGVGTQDVVESDLDNDGVPDSEDPEPLNPEVTEEEITTGDLLGTLGDIFDSTVDQDTTTTTPIKPTATTTTKPTTPTTGTTQPTLPDETGGYGTGTPTEPTVSTKPTTTTTTNKSTTLTTETTEPTLPDETGGYGTGGTTDGGTDTTTTGGTGDGGGDGGGTDGGSGTGNGGGDGDGDGSGIGSGSGSGMFGLGGGGGSQPITPQSFMASISYAPELLTPYMPRQSKDYLAELIARLQK